MNPSPVGPEHREPLAAFRCTTPESPPYVFVVEREIRTTLIEDLESGALEALGFWEGDGLGALIAHSSAGPLWRVAYLATDPRFRHRKRAERLKREVLSRAAAAGAFALTSKVHPDNRPMLDLNRKLGGKALRNDANPSDPYLICTVPTGC